MEQSFRADGALLERKATASGRPTHRSTFSYDAAGNMTAANAWLGGSQVSEVSVSHNAAFEPTSVTEKLYPPSGPAVTKTASYTYQPDGLLASRTIDGKTTNYSHSLSGQEAQTELWGNGPAASRTRTTTYLPNGAPDQITLPNAVAARHSYDSASRLTTRTFSPPGAGEVSSWEAITYDDDDHRTAETVTQRQPNGSTVPLKAGQATYAYDALGRLISAKHPFDQKPATFELDDAGNVIRETGASSRADYNYWMNRLGSRFFSGSDETPDGHPISYSGRSVYSYDPLGDLSRSQTDAKTWVTTQQQYEDDDGEERTLISHFGLPTSNITTTTYDAASHTKRITESDGSWVDYAYDAFSRLVRRTEHTGSGADETTLFFHDGASDSVALETNASGAVKTRYLLGSAGDPLGQEGTSASTRAYYVTDPRGNVTQLVGQDRAVKATFAYDSFGKERPSHTSTSEDWDSRLRFQTAPQDPKTGAYALGPRMYDPSINRFLGADHYVGAAANMSLAADPLTGNRYLYAGANPVGMIDDGHSPQYYYAAPIHWHIKYSWRWDAAYVFEWRQAGRANFFEGVAGIRTSGKAWVSEIWYEMRTERCPSCHQRLRNDLDKWATHARQIARDGAVSFLENKFQNFVDDSLASLPSPQWSAFARCGFREFFGGTPREWGEFIGEQGFWWGLGQLGKRYGARFVPYVGWAKTGRDAGRAASACQGQLYA